MHLGIERPSTDFGSLRVEVLARLPTAPLDSQSQVVPESSLRNSGP